MPETVTIISERRIPLPTSPGATREMIELTYQARNMFPRSVLIDPDHDSAEERQRVIREDLDAARAFVPEQLSIGEPPQDGRTPTA